MPDEYERLRRRIEEGLAAADELQRKLEAAERNDRRKRKRRFRLLKGGLIWGAVLAGVEWFRNYKRIATALAAASITVGGAVIAEQPSLPGADPPAATTRPPDASPTKTPTARPTTALTPRRTSPPRTQAPQRITPPPAAPPSTITTSTITPTKEPTQVSTRPTATKTATSILPTGKPIVSTPVLPTITTPSVALVTPESCTINLLGIRACLPLG